MNFLNQFEIPILNSLHEATHCAFLDAVMPVITKLGNAGIFWILLAVVLLCFKKTRRAGVTMGISLIFGLVLCNLTIKPLVARIRPYDFDTSIKLLIPPEHDFSFPSGHTIASFEGAVSLFIYHKKYGIAAIALACVIAFSRLYLMVHYPTDVITAVILGIAVAIIASFVSKWLIKKTKMPVCD